MLMNFTLNGKRVGEKKLDNVIFCGRPYRSLFWSHAIGSCVSVVGELSWIEEGIQLIGSLLQFQVSTTKTNIQWNPPFSLFQLVCHCHVSNDFDQYTLPICFPLLFFGIHNATVFQLHQLDCLFVLKLKILHCWKKLTYNRFIVTVIFRFNKTMICISFSTHHFIIEFRSHLFHLKSNYICKTYSHNCLTMVSISRSSRMLWLIKVLLSSLQKKFCCHLPFFFLRV